MDKMFSYISPATEKEQFLEQAKAHREERAIERQRENAAIKIQVGKTF